MISHKYIIALVILGVILVSPVVYLIDQDLSPPSLSNSTSKSTQTACTPFLGTPKTLKSNLRAESFGAITKFQLPSPGRAPNAITVSSSDGSVWFGEQAIPGVGHLYPNGTLIEYSWPSDYSSSSTSSNGLYSCSYRTDVWGIALWNGKVWASDTSGNRLVSLDPITGSATSLKLPLNNSFPYTMTVGPDNSLWFTELTSSRIGRVFSNGTLIEYPLQQGGMNEAPAEISFVNSTLGYYVTISGVAGNAKSAVYAFNPQQFSPRIVGQDLTLYSPSSVAASDNGLWIIQHGPSIIAFYDVRTDQLIPYPTSTINYTNTVLPYFVKLNGSHVWFNEHYGNRIAKLDFEKGTLTEYSESNPPATNSSQIDNALTFALGTDRVWFTGWTANYVGFVNASYRPNFSVHIADNSTFELRAGGTANLKMVVEGKSSRPLSVLFSDSESFGAVPRNITAVANVTDVRALNGIANIAVTITAKPTLQPGSYTLLLTISDGLILQSAYVRLYVLG